MHVVSTLPPVRRLELMPTGSTGSKKKNLTGLNVTGLTIHLLGVIFVLGGLPLSKCFLWLIPRWICEITPMNLGNIRSGYVSNMQKCKEKVISEYYCLFLSVAAVLAQRPERLVSLAVATQQHSNPTRYTVPCSNIDILALFNFFPSISLMGSPHLGWLYRNDLPRLRPQQHPSSNFP